MKVLLMLALVFMMGGAAEVKAVEQYDPGDAGQKVDPSQNHKYNGVNIQHGCN